MKKVSLNCRLISVTTLLLLFSFKGSFAFESLNEEQARRWYENARYFFQVKKEYSKAYQCIEKSLELVPDNITARELREEIRKHLPLGSLETSLADEEASLMWTRQGRYFANVKKDYKRAIECFEKALLFNERNETAKELLSSARLKLNYSLEDEIIESKSKSLYESGIENIKNGELARAKNNFSEAVSVNPINIEAQMKLLHFARKERDFKTETEKLNVICKILKYAEIPEKIREQIKHELQCYQNLLTIQVALARFNFDQERKKKLLDRFCLDFFEEDDLDDDMLSLKKDYGNRMEKLDLKKLTELGYLQRELKCPDGGKYTLNQDGLVECSAHGLNPKSKLILTLADARNYRRLGDEHFRQKEYEKALACYLKALPADERNPELLASLGDTYCNLTNFKSALDYYERALEIEKNNPKLLVKMGDVCFLSRDYEKSIEYYEKALEANSDNYWIYYRVSEAYLFLKKPEKAVDILLKAEKAGEKSFKLYFNLGYIYTKMKKISLAIENYSKSLELIEKKDTNYKKVQKILRNLRKL